MRRPEYLSPTSIRTYFKNPEEFYMRYLSETKVPRFPQTKPMSVGSSFDAFVKSYLHEALFGKGFDLRFDLQTLFEAQVESQNRDWAWAHGEHAFNEYKRLGSLGDLMIDLSQAVGKPRFELEIRGVVEGRKEGILKDIKGLPILGKPDVFFINKEGHSVVLDWKVNGWCSASPISPMPGYVKIRGDAKKSGHHKDAHIQTFQGVLINVAMYLEDGDEDWATQLATYGWLCGEEVGASFITAIDQFACGPSGAEYPKIRIAEHRLRVSQAFQQKVYEDYLKVSEVVNTGNLYPELTPEENAAKRALFDEKSKMLVEMAGSSKSEDQLFRELCGMNPKY